MSDADATGKLPKVVRVPDTYLVVDSVDLVAVFGGTGLAPHHIRDIRFPIDPHPDRAVADVAVVEARRRKGLHVCHEHLPGSVLDELRTRLNLRDSQLHPAELSAAQEGDEVLVVTIVGGKTSHFVLYVLRSEAPSDADRTFSESHPPEDLKTKLLQMVKGG